MKFQHLLSGFAFSVIWSSAFTSAKIAMLYAPPFLLLSIRFFISGILGIILARLMGQKANFSWAVWISIIIFGLCQNTVYLGLNFVSMQWIDASLAAIIASLLPIIVAALSVILLRERFSNWTFLGLTAGVLGVLMLAQEKISYRIELLGTILCFAAVISLATATIILRNIKDNNIVMIVGIQMFVGGFTLFPISFLFETWDIIWSKELVLAFWYTTLIPGLFATILWLKLLNQIGPTKAASFHFLNPFFGVLIANLILKEPLLPQHLLGVIVIMIGILAVQKN